MGDDGVGSAAVAGVELVSGGDMDIVTYLRKGELRHLFIEHLGWDRANGQLAIELGDQPMALEQIAQKRGFLVVRLITDRIRGQTKRFIRDVQARVSRHSHEHLLIVQTERTDVQVWAWAYRDSSNGRLRHRFHPMFSDRIPPKLVQRIQRLSVSLDEEEQITLFDVTEKTKESLDTEADQSIFFRSPSYAERSHELALRMRSGGKREFDEFIIFHHKLATWFARRYKHLVNDEEGMAQEAMAGLIRSASTFDPSRGTAFSTYAFNGMKNECFRAVPRLVPLSRVPDHLYWPFRKVLARWDRATRIGGYIAGLDARDDAIAEQGLDPAVAVDLYRFFFPELLSDLNTTDWIEAIGAEEYNDQEQNGDRYRHPLSDIIRKELNEILYSAVDSLPKRDAAIILARVGLGTPLMTLQELGDNFRLTRERVRQLEKKSLERMKSHLLRDYPSEFSDWSDNRAGTGDIADPTTTGDEASDDVQPIPDAT